ncbi:CDP-diacylglycerol diphosphatase [Rosenbergiella australiborealis]|uniref:CDP-diacylglycerol pyrophosphatase n=1 Tax=Rosenbergiella australiborealis TaxID=1544696 RepID=UPI001F4D8E07
MRSGCLKKIVVTTSLLAVLVVAFFAYRFHAHSDVLWRIVSQQCIPHQRQSQQPEPCQHVDLAQGYALLKDNVGIAQYLLIPTDKISGVESPALLQPQTPNYFYLAWQQLPQLNERLGRLVPPTDLALAINGKWGRSQNQLHIHLSCLRGDVQQQLSDYQTVITSKWQTLPLLNHQYWVRSLSLEQLQAESLFRQIYADFPNINPKSGQVGIALTQLADGRLVVMVLRTDWLKGVLGSAEELQDHQCRVVFDKYRS